MTETQLFHASSVALRVPSGSWVGAAFWGPSGSGKSDLALRLLHELGPERCRLVADDYVTLACSGERVTVSAPAALAGRIEVRGVGLVDAPARDGVELVAVFRLGTGKAIPRMPEPDSVELASLGDGLPAVSVRVFDLNAFEASASAKVSAAVQLICAGADRSQGLA